MTRPWLLVVLALCVGCKHHVAHRGPIGPLLATQQQVPIVLTRQNGQSATVWFARLDGDTVRGEVRRPRRFVPRSSEPPYEASAIAVPVADVRRIAVERWSILPNILLAAAVATALVSAIALSQIASM